MKIIQASLEVRIATAQRMISAYESNIAAFESGAATPDVGELMANRMLLSRKRKQLRKMMGEKAIRTVARLSLTQVLAA